MEEVTEQLQASLGGMQQLSDLQEAEEEEENVAETGDDTTCAGSVSLYYYLFACSTFTIPELPSGDVMEMEFLSTWGDPFYVGLNGIDLFCNNGERAPVKEVWYAKNRQRTTILRYKPYQLANNHLTALPTRIGCRRALFFRFFSMTCIVSV